MRLFINFMGMWVSFTIAIYYIAHATNKERLSLAKAVGFGFCTAALAAMFAVALVILF